MGEYNIINQKCKLKNKPGTPEFSVWCDSDTHYVLDLKIFFLVLSQ